MSFGMCLGCVRDVFGVCSGVSLWACLGCVLVTWGVSGVSFRAVTGVCLGRFWGV